MGDKRKSKGGVESTSGSGQQSVPVGSCPGCGKLREQLLADLMAVDVLNVFRAIIVDPNSKPSERHKAAVSLAQYTETRTKDGGKKQAREKAAQKVAGSSKFAPPDAPARLVAVK